MSILSRGTAWGGALTLAGACVAAVAAPPTKPAPVADAAPASTVTPAASAGLRAYIDPETGRLVERPVTTEQQRAAAQDIAAPDFSKIQEIRHPDGSIETIFNGQVDNALIATVGKDGKVSMHCSEAGHDHAADGAAASTEARDDR